MRILHSTGMLFPTKYGSFEKWIVEFGKQACIRGDTVFVAYKQTFTGVDIYRREAEKQGIIFVSINSDEEFLLFCQRECIDIVHFHFDFQEHRILYRRLAKNKVALYATLHCECGYAVDKSWRKNFGSLIRVLGHRIKTCFIGRFFVQIFAVGNIIKEQYRRFYFWPGRLIRCQYLGIQRQHIKREEAKKQIPIISCIAFHSPIKGVDVLIDALKILKDKDVKFRCLQIGGGSSELDGEDTKKLMQMAENMGLTEELEWIGITNNVNSYLENSDIYCQPSRTEALGLSIAEAMQNGLPVVATAVGGIPELVRNGENGFLVKTSDAEALAEKLELLICDQDMRERMGARSIQLVQEMNFYQDQSVVAVYSHYKIVDVK